MTTKFEPSITYHFYFGTGMYKIVETRHDFIVVPVADGSEESALKIYNEITRRVTAGETISEVVDTFPRQYPVRTI